jgi:hypothetical protein
MLALDRFSYLLCSLSISPIQHWMMGLSCPIIEKWLAVLCEQVTDSTNWFLLLTLNTTLPPCFTSKIKRSIRSHTVMLHSSDNDLTATLSLQYTVWLQNSTVYGLQKKKKVNSKEKWSPKLYSGPKLPCSDKEKNTAFVVWVYFPFVSQSCTSMHNW